MTRPVGISSVAMRKSGIIVATIVFALSPLALYAHPSPEHEVEGFVETENVRDFVWNESGGTLFLFYQDNTISIYDMNTGQYIVSRKHLQIENPSSINNAATVNISPDGASVAIISLPRDGVVIVHVFKTEDLIKEEKPISTIEEVFSGAQTGLTSGTFSLDSKSFFVSHEKGAFYVIKIDEGSSQKIQLLESDIPRGFAEISSGRIAVLAEGSGGLNDVIIVDFRSGEMLKRIKVGPAPKGIIYNVVTKRIFVSHLGSDDVHIIDERTLSRVAVLRVGKDPESLEYDKKSGTVFVANNTSGTLSIISPALTVTTIDLRSTAYTSGDYPLRLHYVDAQKKLFILNPTESKLIVYDVVSGQVVKEIRTDPRPRRLSGSESQQKIFLAHSNAESVWIIDAVTLDIDRIQDTAMATTAVTEEKSFFSRPHSVTVDAVGNRIFVANLAENNITVIDGNTQKPITKITVNTSPQIIGYHPGNKQLYAVSPVDNTLAIVDASKDDYPVRFVPTGRQPNSLTANLDMGRLYISNSGDASITVIDTTTMDHKVIATINFPGGLFPLVSTVADNKLYVALYGSANIAVIDGLTNKIEQMIPIGENPIWIRFVGQRIVVTTEGEKKLIFINPNKNNEITGSIAFQDTPYRIFHSDDFASGEGAENADITAPSTPYVYVVFRRMNKVAVVKMNLGEKEDLPMIVGSSSVPFLGELDTKYNLIKTNLVSGLSYISHGAGNRVYVVRVLTDKVTGQIIALRYATIKEDGSVNFAPNSKASQRVPGWLVALLSLIAALALIFWKKKMVLK